MLPNLFDREELFYQLGARQFGDFGKFLLDPAPDIRTLIQLAVDCETGVEKSGRTKDQVTDVSCLHLPPFLHS